MQLSELDDYSAKFKSGKNHLPDVILVRKCYPKVWKRMSKRMWKLKQLEKEALGEDDIWGDKKSKRKITEEKINHNQKDADMRNFI
jgi:hypothetical protein